MRPTVENTNAEQRKRLQLSGSDMAMIFLEVPEYTKAFGANRQLSR